METPKILPKGTTQEQWDRYQEDLKNHEEICERKKPKKSDFGFIGNMPPDYEGLKAYENAYSNWHMMYCCDAPNEPGYYRANND